MTNQDTNPNPRNTLKKVERLCHQRAFDLLYQTGTPIFVQGIRFLVSKVADPITADQPSIRVKVAFVVPKKYVRKAVMRNLLKRRLREIYRLKKNEFYNSLVAEGIYCHLSIIYLSKKEYSYKYLQSIFEKAIPLILESLQKQSLNAQTDGMNTL